MTKWNWIIWKYNYENKRNIWKTSLSDTTWSFTTWWKSLATRSKRQPRDIRETMYDTKTEFKLIRTKEIKQDTAKVHASHICKKTQTAKFESINKHHFKKKRSCVNPVRLNDNWIELDTYTSSDFTCKINSDPIKITCIKIIDDSFLIGRNPPCVIPTKHCTTTATHSSTNFAHVCATIVSMHRITNKVCDLFVRDIKVI